MLFWKPEGNRLVARPKKEGRTILKWCYDLLLNFQFHNKRLSIDKPTD
jgi:hypothetical protein